MIQEIDIIEEGIVYESLDVVLAHDSVKFKQLRIPLRELYSKKHLGFIYNLRRRGSVIVGDTEVNTLGAPTTPYFNYIKAIEIGNLHVYTEATLVCVYIG